MNKLQKDNLEIQTPYDIDYITYLQYTKQPNQHGELILKGTIKAGYGQNQIDKSTLSDNIKITTKQEPNQPDHLKELFEGIVTNLIVKETDQNYTIEIKAKTYTYLMDLEQKSRSFQNQEGTLEDIIKQIVREDNKGDYIDRATKKRLQPELLIQYEETDWEFLKRIASIVNTVIIPHSSTTKPKVWIGIPTGETYKSQKKFYTTEKDLNKYNQHNQNIEPKHQINYVSHQITTNKIYDLGDKITLNNTTYTVEEAEITIQDNEMKNTYTLAKEETIIKPKETNPRIPGISIEGKVLEVQGTKAKLHLKIDKTQDQTKAKLFNIGTMYSDETGTGLYVMPEQEDYVLLYFPNGQEENAYIRGIIRKDGKTNPKTNDPKTQYFGTPNKKEISITPEQIKITSNQDEQHITQNDQKGIDITSNIKLNLETHKKLEIKAKTINLESNKGIELSSGLSSIIMNKNIHVRGSKIRIKKVEDIATNEEIDVVENKINITIQKISVNAKEKKRLLLAPPAPGTHEIHDSIEDNKENMTIDNDNIRNETLEMRAYNKKIKAVEGKKSVLCAIAKKNRWRITENKDEVTVEINNKKVTYTLDEGKISKINFTPNGTKHIIVSCKELIKDFNFLEPQDIIHKVGDKFTSVEQAAIAHQLITPSNNKDIALSVIYSPNLEGCKFTNVVDYKEVLKWGKYSGNRILAYSIYGTNNPDNLKDIDTNGKKIYYTNDKGKIKCYDKLPIWDIYAISESTSSSAFYKYMTRDKQENNALYIYYYLTKKGWSKNAIAGLLGNIEQESVMNPGAWQYKGNIKQGYGLVQWTPANEKYLKDKGVNDDDINKYIKNMIANAKRDLMDSQLEYLLSTMKPGGEWIAQESNVKNHYNAYPLDSKTPRLMSYNDYITSTVDAGELALVFQAHYERSGDYKVEKIEGRLQKRYYYAQVWYVFLKKY